MLDHLRLHIEALRNRDEGQALVEYALILFLVSIVSIGVLTILGTTVRGVFQGVINAI
jgi:pilus assembly protein Flp/PilA